MTTHGEHKTIKKRNTKSIPIVVSSTPATICPKLKPHVKQNEVAACATATAAVVVCGAVDDDILLYFFKYLSFNK